MNLTQLEWIKSSLKRKSYECFKPYCNSRILIYEIVIIFFLSPIPHVQIPWPWGLRRGGGARPPQGDDHAAQGTRARRWGPLPGGSSRGQTGSHARQPPGRPRHAAAPPLEPTLAGAVRARARGRASRRRGRGAGEQGATSPNPRNWRKRRTRMEFTGEEDLRRSRSQIHRLPEIRESNRRTERAATKPSMRRTQRYPRIRQTMHGLGVIARRSCH
jgi:hypothetical protein